MNYVLSTGKYFFVKKLASYTFVQKNGSAGSMDPNKCLKKVSRQTKSVQKIKKRYLKNVDGVGSSLSSPTPKVSNLNEGGHPNSSGKDRSLPLQGYLREGRNDWKNSPPMAYKDGCAAYNVGANQD